MTEADAALPTTTQRITEMLHAVPARLGNTRLLCIDGPAGSGKTTFAEAIAATLQAQGSVHLLHMDDLYEGWTGLHTVDRRIRDTLLIPLAEGRTATYRRYDWHAADFAERHTVQPVDVLILEGVGAGSQLLAPCRSLLVWVEADEALRLQRSLIRDGEAMQPHLVQWRQDEARHFAGHRTRDCADLHVDGWGGLSERINDVGGSI